MGIGGGEVQPKPETALRPLDGEGRHRRDRRLGAAHDCPCRLRVQGLDIDRDPAGHLTGQVEDVASRRQRRQKHGLAGAYRLARHRPVVIGGPQPESRALGHVVTKADLEIHPPVTPRTHGEIRTRAAVRWLDASPYRDAPVVACNTWVAEPLGRGYNPVPTATPAFLDTLEPGTLLVWDDGYCLVPRFNATLDRLEARGWRQLWASPLPPSGSPRARVFVLDPAESQ